MNYAFQAESIRKKIWPKSLLGILIVFCATLILWQHTQAADDGLPPTLVSFTSTTPSGTYDEGEVVNITANFDEDIAPGSTLEIQTSLPGGTIVLDQVSGSTISKDYTVQLNDYTDLLVIESITSSSVTSIDDNPPVTKTDYDLSGVLGLEETSEILINAIPPTISFLSARTTARVLTITFAQPLNPNSIPDRSAFTVRVNGSPVSLSGAVQVSGATVTLTLENIIGVEDVITVDYTVPSSNKLQSASDPTLLAAALSGQVARNTLAAISIPTRSAWFTAVHGTKLYISGNALDGQDNDVTVIDTITDTVRTSVRVQQYPYNIVTVGNKGYVVNQQSNSVSVIDLQTNTLIKNVAVGTIPYVAASVGNKVYVTNQHSDNVSVINTDTDTVVSTIAVGGNPTYVIAMGTKVYVSNQDDNNISIIDTNTDTVIGTLNVGSSFFSTIVGKLLYIGNAIVNTLSNTIADTFSAGTDIGSAGKKVFVDGLNNFSILDSETNTVDATVSVGTNPVWFKAVGNKLYVVNNQTNGTVSVINLLTNTVTKTIPVGNFPRMATLVGTKLYIINNGSQDISIIDTVTDTKINVLAPRLMSFSTTAGSGTYAPGQTIPIFANFDKDLHSSSTMTVELNTGRTVQLNYRSQGVLFGTYTVQDADQTPDLAVSSIVSSSVWDAARENQLTRYEVPLSEGDFTGENSLIARNIGDAKDIVIGSFLSIEVGSNPYQISPPITVSGTQYIYVANQGESSVDVVRLLDKSVVTTIPVGDEPYGLTTVTISGTTYVYIVNTLSNDVSVIDTTSNTVIATVDVGIKPYYAAAIGTDVYVTNSTSNTVSVIDANTNTVTDTISVGVYPRGIKAHGTNLYVANYGDENYPGGNSISVIDSLTNTVSEMIVTPLGSSGPRGMAVSGDYVYVANFRSNDVSVIDTDTNSVTATISVGAGPRGIAVLGSKLYVENFDAGTVSVINTATNTVVDTIHVGHSPSGITPVGTDLYISRFQDNALSILDTVTGELKPLTLSVTTESVTDIKPQEATFRGAISDIGEESAATRGFIYGMTSAYGSTVVKSGTQGIGSFNSILSLTPGTTYYYRAFATNSFGTVYGDQKSFTTSSYGAVVLPSGLNGGFTLPPQPQTVAAPTVPVSPQTPTIPVVSGACSPYFVGSIRTGLADPALVRKLQEFLNTYEKETLAVDGVYGPQTMRAVIRFQEKYRTEILAPWGLSSGTGMVSLTTSAKMNALVCGQQLGCPHFTEYVKAGESKPEVAKIKSFLNTLDATLKLDTTSNADAAFVAAVSKFQLRYKDFILKPWGLSRPTGYWYKTTSAKANEFMGCVSPQE